MLTETNVKRVLERAQDLEVMQRKSLRDADIGESPVSLALRSLTPFCSLA
jgi:hypothetical protein